MPNKSSETDTGCDATGAGVGEVIDPRVFREGPAEELLLVLLIPKPPNKAAAVRSFSVSSLGLGGSSTFTGDGINGELLLAAGMP